MPPLIPPPGATYVQMARGLQVRDRQLTLIELSPATIFIGPDPETAIGHLSTADFLDQWPALLAGRGEAPAEELPRPPLGVLSRLDAGARMSGDAVLLLAHPRFTAAGLQYEVDLLRGTLPSSSGACVLFINPASTPETPASRWVAGHATRLGGR